MKKNVILVYAGEKCTRPRLPLALLFLSETLEKNGYKPMIIDMRIDDWKSMDLDNPICVGLSVMTGPPISYALEFAKHVRDVDPNIPIVWGGVHPSLLPEQTILNEYVDIVVRGEGELTFLELVQKLELNESLKHVKGITYKENGEVISNPDREWMDLNEIGNLPYHLLDLSKYNLKEFPYHSSRGCPHKCGFCYNLAFNKGSYRFKNAENVVNEIEYIVNKFNPETIWFVEDDFFASKKRVREICEGFIERGLKINWEASCVVSYFARYDSTFINLLKESGCKKLAFGAESGSSRILEYIDKNITVEETIKAVEKCKDWDIVPVISFLCGLPEETREDTYKTIGLIKKIREINDKAIINGFFLYTPYPNTPITNKLHEQGYEYPSSLEDWSDFLFAYGSNNPWLDDDYRKEIETISDIVRFQYFNKLEASSRLKSKLHIIPYKIFNSLYSISAKIRWKYEFFKYPIEWKLWSWIRIRYLGQT